MAVSSPAGCSWRRAASCWCSSSRTRPPRKAPALNGRRAASNAAGASAAWKTHIDQGDGAEEAQPIPAYQPWQLRKPAAGDSRAPSSRRARRRPIFQVNEELARLPLHQLYTGGLTALFAPAAAAAAASQEALLTDIEGLYAYLPQAHRSADTASLAFPPVAALRAELQARNIPAGNFLAWCYALHARSLAELRACMQSQEPASPPSWPTFLLHQAVQLARTKTEAAEAVQLIGDSLNESSSRGAMTILSAASERFLLDRRLYSVAQPLTRVVLRFAQRSIEAEAAGIYFTSSTCNSKANANTSSSTGCGDGEKSTPTPVPSSPVKYARQALYKHMKTLEKMRAADERCRAALGAVRAFVEQHAAFAKLRLRREARAARSIVDALTDAAASAAQGTNTRANPSAEETLAAASTTSVLIAAHRLLESRQRAGAQLPSPTSMHASASAAAAVHAVTKAMEHLLKHGDHEAVVELWRTLMHRRIQPNSSTLSAVVCALIHLGHPAKAVEQLESWLAPAATSSSGEAADDNAGALELQSHQAWVQAAENGKEKALPSPRPIVGTSLMLAETLQALVQQDNDPVIFPCLQLLLLERGVQPDNRCVDIILRAAKHASPLPRYDGDGNMQQQHYHGAANATATTWNDELPALVARDAFLACISAQYPELIAARNPLEEAVARAQSGWLIKSEMSMRKLENWVASRFHLHAHAGSGSHTTAAAAWIERWRHIGATRSVIFESRLLQTYMLLLHRLRLLQLAGDVDGALPIGDEILRVLAWHRALHLVPSHMSVCLACMEVVRSVPPASLARWGGAVGGRARDGLESAAGPLHAWLADWLGEEAVPKEEEVAQVWVMTSRPQRIRE
ncbi:hypothetical protein K437DRAFT_257447 [Tilletiaria anomala UBC 951]|uniref:Uncharacterized protein n=1 Tax=Tilletiaria anomala (strain ATCC 24038 / CBS 436.72 / UBC 951) TaxID=1037660 RepID=A0A066VP77_TILAU|nr:uncharacterized protein K437DRAFT_257447 [Tilletiaria anomala UBC 951]KDN43552.1 hypothetical protein K437DRAFT_257447 [Tilletiaria anomala UBC 951]